MINGVPKFGSQARKLLILLSGLSKNAAYMAVSRRFMVGSDSTRPSVLSQPTPPCRGVPVQHLDATRSHPFGCSTAWLSVELPTAEANPVLSPADGATHHPDKENRSVWRDILPVLLLC